MSTVSAITRRQLDRQGEQCERGRGRETPADFIVMALMKMVLVLLQSFLA